ncbi:hypothetical protein CMI37_13835 [Candidatus Pacearchaeota archaeon]|nr:hypothetical protein [Candidatus Pacearchaeota archaeon]|tara:strand:- start:1853 stop:3274 length:1422 start_codon:yes stop_codon:yes gene_type:complete
MVSEVKDQIVHLYTPLDWQLIPWNAKARVILLTGSAGGGKSRVAAEKVNAFLKLYPGAMGLMVRKTRESMTNSTVLFMSTLVVGTDDEVKHKQDKHRFEYDNGSILAYGGMKDEEQREQVRSIGLAGGLDIVWIEEANKLTETDYQELLARLRGVAAPWVQIILTTNPDAPSHWINQRLILGGEAKVYYSHAEDNPYNPKGYIETLNSLTGVTAKRLREGLWVQAEGVVYDDYDPEVHLLEHRDIPPSWRRFRCVDFGYTNPFVCQWWAADDDGRLYLYREIYKTRLLTEDAARDILSAEITMRDQDGKAIEMEYIEETICDHDAEDRATLERYLREGITEVRSNQEEYLVGFEDEEEPEIERRFSSPLTKGADKKVQAGIKAVQTRLRPTGDGKPRIFFLKGALAHTPDASLRERSRPTSTVEELPAYVWHSDQSGKPVKEEPVKEDDHGMDDMRYMVMRFDGKGSKEVLFV